MKIGILNGLLKSGTLNPLLDFAKEIYSIFNILDIRPIIYGSFAYLYHIKDTSIPIRDIDLLVPESDFTHIQKKLDNLKDVTYRVMPYQSIEVFKNGMEIDIDSMEQFLDPRSRESESVVLNGIEFNFLNINSLSSIYEEALENMPDDLKLNEKRNRYQIKLDNLKMLKKRG